MAITNQDKLDSVMRRVNAKSSELTGLLSRISGTGGEDVVIKPLSIKPYPRRAWVLIGVDIDDYRKIEGHVREISGVEGVDCEISFQGSSIG
jgi:hypothetical protein